MLGLPSSHLIPPSFPPRAEGRCLQRSCSWAILETKHASQPPLVSISPYYQQIHTRRSFGIRICRSWIRVSSKKTFLPEDSWWEILLLYQYLSSPPTSSETMISSISTTATAWSSKTPRLSSPQSPSWRCKNAKLACLLLLLQPRFYKLSLYKTLTEHVSPQVSLKHARVLQGEDRIGRSWRVEMEFVFVCGRNFRFVWKHEHNTCLHFDIRFGSWGRRGIYSWILLPITSDQ